MGALEAYTAAVFVRLFGHSPSSVAMAPTVYFAALVAGQFAAWRSWKGRACGHLAALFTLACSPMMAIWSVIPRGGYTEVLAWGLATMAVYRGVTRPDRPPLGPLAQLGWGALFTFGYFLNPLSLVVYVALAIDWTLGRHGVDIRRERGPRWRWLDRPWAGLAWMALLAIAVALVAIGCHVIPETNIKPRYVFLLDLVPGKLGAAAGIAVVLGTFALAGWWTGLARRVVSLLARHPAFMLGALIGVGPFLIYAVRVKLGLSPLERSLPVWVRPPWAVGPNVVDGLAAVGPLFAGQVRGGNVPYLCLPLFRLPEIAWPGVAEMMEMLTPAVAILLLALLITAVRRDRAAWRWLFGLWGASPTRPTVLATIGLGSCVGLYLLQATSLDGSSIRYLLPAWLFLPGLLASALLAWPRPRGPGQRGCSWRSGRSGRRASSPRWDGPSSSAGSPTGSRLRARAGSSPAGRSCRSSPTSRTVGSAGSSSVRTGPGSARAMPTGSTRPGRSSASSTRRSRAPPATSPASSSAQFVASRPDRARLIAEVEHYRVWRLDVPLRHLLGDAGDPLPAEGDSAIVAR